MIACDLRDEALSVVARRRIPRVYVVDERCEVLLQDVDARPLPDAVRRIAVSLMASAPGDEVLLGLTDDAELVRLVRLSGEPAARYALFRERLETRSPLDETSKRYGLSSRERDVLERLLRGDSTAAIAENLIIAESTVASHVRNIGAKMNASKRKEIVAAVLGGR